MKNNFTITNLFSCPIYKIRIDPNSYDKEKILKDIKYNKSLKNTRNSLQENFGNCDIHHSYKDHNNENFRTINYEKLLVVYQKFFKFFFDKVLFTTKQFNWNFEIVNYSAITEGQYFPIHNHIESAFAMVHYLNFKDDHKLTRFYNPATFAQYMRNIRPELYNVVSDTIDNSYMYEFFDMPVEEDDILIFPATLNHEIPAQGPAKEIRITISSNLEIL
jgi:hypothetical protein